MIVVSDTTPIHYLILIGEESVLPAIFGEVIIPKAVADEMRHPNAPRKISEWINGPPAWAIIRAEPPDPSATIGGLGKGETAAISIALGINADAVLMDDRKAIREARALGLTTLTTFAVLEIAAINGLIDLDTALNKLFQTNFRFPPDEIVEEYLRRHRERDTN